MPDETPPNTEPSNQPANTGNGSTSAEAASREAASYRVKLREAEKQRDELANVVLGLWHAEVRRLAGGRLADPDDLMGTLDLQSVLGEGGTVDPAKVDAAVDDLLREHPHYGRKPPTPSAVAVGLGSSREPTPPAQPRTWRDVLTSSGQQDTT